MHPVGCFCWERLDNRVHSVTLIRVSGWKIDGCMDAFSVVFWLLRVKPRPPVSHEECQPAAVTDSDQAPGRYRSTYQNRVVSTPLN